MPTQQASSSEVFKVSKSITGAFNQVLNIASIVFASCTLKPNSSPGQLVSQSTKTSVLKASFLVQAKVSLNLIVLDEIGMANKNYAVSLATVQSKANDPNIQKLNQLVVDPKLKDYINTALQWGDRK